MGAEALPELAPLPVDAPKPFDPAAVPVRWSHLKRMGVSPMHYLHGLTHDSSMTPAMRFGKLVHKHLLGGDLLVIYPGERRGNAWKDFQAANDTKWIVTADEYERSARCAGALHAHPIASNIVVGNLELEVDWKTSTGRRAQSHVDAAGWNWVSELKTAASASPGWFKYQAIKMGYHAQLAFYRDALTSIGRTIEHAYIAAVEAKAPYAVTVFTLTARALDEGARLNRLWLEQLRACEESKAWPAYCESMVELDAIDMSDLTLLIDGEEIAA